MGCVARMSALPVARARSGSRRPVAEFSRVGRPLVLADWAVAAEATPDSRTKNKNRRFGLIRIHPRLGRLGQVTGDQLHHAHAEIIVEDQDFTARH